MMMENGGSNTYGWQFDETVNDDDMCMDVESFLSILAESDPDGSLQNAQAGHSLSFSPCSEPASHVGVNEQSQTHNGLFTFSSSDRSGASGSRTVCSSPSSDSERRMVNFDFTKVESRPDAVSSMNLSSGSLGDWELPVPGFGVPRHFSSFSQHDGIETNFERGNSNETIVFSGGNGNQQWMDTSGIIDGIYCDSVADSCRTSVAPNNVEAPPIDFSRYSECVYDTDDGCSILPSSIGTNEPSYLGPSGHCPNSSLHPMTNYDGMLHNVQNSSLISTMNYETQAESLNGVDLVDDVGSQKSCGIDDWMCTDKIMLQSFPGVFTSSKDHVVKGEQDSHNSHHFNNVVGNTCRSNTPLSDNCRLDVQSQGLFLPSDFSIKKLVTFTNEERSKFAECHYFCSPPSKINQQAVSCSTVSHSISVDDDDPDICILEDISQPAPKKQSQVDGKSVVTAQRSSLGAPPIHMGFNNVKLKTNDERFIYRVALQDLSQPKSEASPPDGALAVPLLRHQRIALSWMVQKETRSMHCFGGILADDQGLGKTISMIALILKERSPSSSVHTAEMKVKAAETLNLEEDDDAMTELHESKENAKSCMMESDRSSIERVSTPVQTRSRPAAGTLVVCPTSVLRQWNDELHNKVSSKANLSVLVYHGGNRTKDPFELSKYDVVLTTYAIVSMEVPKQPLVDEDDDETKRRNEYLPVGFSSNNKRKYPPTSGKCSKKDKKGMDSDLFESLARPLAKVRWFRVILDEAQSIKNHKTQVARACWGLRAKRRWCLSGTPIQNAIDDLYSYFRFLRYDPYAGYKSFCSTIKAPIQRCPATGYKKLQAVLKTIMLRRTKGTLLDGEPVISLPPKTVNLKKVDFTAEERDFYCRLEADSRAQFAEYAAAGTVKQNYVNILLMLLRLRQACDHPLLVKGCSSTSAWKSSVEKAKKLTPEKRSRLLNCLEASLAICGICSDPPEDAVVTTCEHVFCNQCILEHLSSDDSQCPSSKCKALLGRSSVFSRSTLRISVGDQPGPGNSPDCSNSVKTEVLEPCSFGGSVNSLKIEATEALDSSKIKTALEVLQSIATPRDITIDTDSFSSVSGYAGSPEKVSNDISGVFDKDAKVKGNSVVREKAIVFSQWTRMLDLLESCLKDSSIGYRRLDGTMSVVARDKAVKDFNTLPEVTVMIMSLKAASLGLNMVSACHVLLLDLWWNPTTEDQAIDRAHRIGQTRPVTVLRLTVKDTVEDRILALQQKKREMVSSAFGEDETGSRQTRLTVDDLKYLFQA